MYANCIQAKIPQSDVDGGRSQAKVHPAADRGETKASEEGAQVGDHWCVWWPDEVARRMGRIVMCGRLKR